MSKFWESIVNVVSPRYQTHVNPETDALFAACMLHLRRAGAPSRVDALYAEAMSSINAAVTAMKS